MNRRGFLGSLLASLAAPAIIRTPGLLMPIRPLVTATGGHDFMTDKLIIRASERYAVQWQEWSGMWRTQPGDMASFDPAEDSVSRAMAGMKRLRQMEERTAALFRGPRC
jgi:hypothetical protein